MNPGCAIGLACALSCAVLPVTARAQAAHAAPKVVVVVSGDPDPALRDAAATLERELRSSAQVVLPADAGLRGALRGVPAPAEDDGLDRARVERRRLGWSEARDAPVLAGIAERTGAVAVVIVRRHQGTLEAVVFDGRAGAFFDGALALPAADAGAEGRFVAARARAAATRAVTTHPAGATTAGDRPASAQVTTATTAHDHANAQGTIATTAGDRPASAQVTTATTAHDHANAQGTTTDHGASDDATAPHPASRSGASVPGARAAARGASSSPPAAGRPAASGATAGAPPRSPRGSWLSRNWPYLVAVVLAGGAVTYVALSAGGSAAPSPPVIRLHTGN